MGTPRTAQAKWTGGLSTNTVKLGTKAQAFVKEQWTKVEGAAFIEMLKTHPGFVVSEDEDVAEVPAVAPPTAKAATQPRASAA